MKYVISLTCVFSHVNLQVVGLVENPPTDLTLVLFHWLVLSPPGVSFASLEMFLKSLVSLAD